MIRHDFSQFSYAINNDSAKKGKKEILVCFMYNGTEVLKKVYIPEKEGTAYIFEAKKIIDQEMRNGDLAAYAHKFAAKNKKKEGGSSKPKTSSSSSSSNVGYALPPKKGLKIAFVIVCILLVGAIALAIFFMLKQPEPTPAPVVEDKIAVTFDAGEGSWNGTHAKTVMVDEGTKWSEITKPSAPTAPEGKDIRKQENEVWFIGTTPVASDYTFNKDTTVSAKYDDKTFTLTFGIGAHGEWADGEQSTTREITNVTYGTTWGELLAAYEDELAINSAAGYTHIGFSAISEPLLTDYYPFTTEDATKTFIAQYEENDPTDVMVTIDPGKGTFQGGSSEIISVSATIGETTWAELLAAHPVTASSGYVATPTWEYRNLTTETWDEVPVGGLTITEATEFRAIFTPRSDLSIQIDPNGGTWVEAPEGDEGQPKKFENISYETTWEQFKEGKEDELAVVPPSDPTPMQFVYFEVGEGTDAQIVTNSYVINDQDQISAVYVASSEAKEISLSSGEYGTFAGQPSATIHVPYGKTWGEVKAAFTPSMKDEYKDLFEFDYFTTDGQTQFPDNSVISATSPSTLTAHYAEITGGNFATDSWSVIKREADKGVDSFNAKYNNPLGQTREVELFGDTYTVKLIGMGHDTLAGEGVTAKATLTFEFEEVITEGIGYINYSAVEGEYDGSNIQSYLNNVVFNSLPDDLRGAISTVKKSTYNYGSSAVTITEDNLFPLSLSEMGYAQDPRETDVQNEGAAYANHAQSARSATAFWTRSPAPANPFAAWAIDENGQLGLPGPMYDHEASEMTLGLGVAPAFCIGSVE